MEKVDLPSILKNSFPKIIQSNFQLSCDFIAISPTTIPHNSLNSNQIIQLIMSIDIKILQSACCGPDIPVKEEIETAAVNADVDVTIEQPTELEEIMKYGTMTFPSIVVNGKVHDYSKFKDQEKLEALLKESTKVVQ